MFYFFQINLNQSERSLNYNINKRKFYKKKSYTIEIFFIGNRLFLRHNNNKRKKNNTHLENVFFDMWMDLHVIVHWLQSCKQIYWRHIIISITQTAFFRMSPSFRLFFFSFSFLIRLFGRLIVVVFILPIFNWSHYRESWPKEIKRKKIVVHERMSNVHTDLMDKSDRVRIYKYFNQFVCITFFVFFFFFFFSCV